MADAPLQPLPHLRLIDRGQTQVYQPRNGRGPALRIPERNRPAHGAALLNNLNALRPHFDQRRAARAAFELAVPEGITIEFRSAPGFDLAFEKLDLAKSRIELLNAREIDGVYLATCYVPDGKLDVLANKVTAYIHEVTRHNKPKNASLVESIESIGLATIGALWTDDQPMPEGDGDHWWEVWIRTAELPTTDSFNRFLAAAQILNIHVAQQRLEFPERVVTTIRASRALLSQAVDLLNLIAEVRCADRPPVVPHELPLIVQDEIVEELAGRIELGGDGVSVAILDTGINRAHPLIAPALAEQDLHAVEPGWGVHDHHGHGTRMAGLALYGDLRNAVAAAGSIELPFRLEGSKIIAPVPVGADQEVLGGITAQGVYRCEIQAPGRRRVICKAITSSMHQQGEPSSYSGAIDQLAFASDEEEKRLFVISAGNVPDDNWLQYPTSNQLYGVEQPGQAWNALTIGAYTEKQELPGTVDYVGWSALALPGDLSPFSSTSCTWGGGWPIKPDVLFEGGNVAVDPAVSQANIPISLQLLTTNRNHNVNPIAPFSMTSAATAQAARLAAQVYCAYPDFWPETTRGLVVHYADWTKAQKDRYLVDNTLATRRHLLRTCGYGVPNEYSVLHSSRNRVCLIAQEIIQPYRLDGTIGKMNELCVFQLPWPKEILYVLAEQPLQLRVTLSYFVEPSPAKRGWTSRYRYASHGLRFDLRRQAESAIDFNKRINLAMRDGAELIDAPEDAGWLFGDKLRRFGSVHSDRWTGMAIDLASRDRIAVYPVVGWWRQRIHRGRCEATARFSLIVSLDANDVDIDLYTEIQNQLEIPIEAGIEV
jgi:subtilisin family serine protease